MRKLIPLIAVAALLTACGSDSDTSANNTYVTQLDAVQARFTAATTAIGARVNDDSEPEDDRRSMSRFEDAASTLASELRTIEVPADARRPHADLVDAAGDYATSIREIERTLRGTTASRAAVLPSKVQQASATFDRRLKAATRAINQKLGAG